MQPIISNSSDFLFIYEAIQSNPNGDPDQENKPRMDYDTKTNLVTDTRIKRFIRDYLKDSGKEIFVDLVEDRKVDMSQRIEGVVKKTLKDELDNLENTFKSDDLFKLLKTIINASKLKGNEKKEDYLEIVWSILTISTTKEKNDLKKDKHLKQFAEELRNIKQINLEILAYMVKSKFIDIRLFGSAFAITGFNLPYTGPIQLNWGYSFNKVELIDSSSIVTIMNDDSSTFGKDYRVHYSLLGFNGTINAPAAKTTGLANDDVLEFRKAIWESIPASPTRSKLNQYPKLYLEIVYNEGVSNGQFGDLRNFVETEPKEGISDKQVRKFKDLSIDLSALKKLIADDKNGENKIKEVIVKTSADFDFSL
ncbi:CRISPR-associated protein Csh2 [Arenibacter nanhaiticus]|uniref:CRISPR-associated protein Csh2 n=1 Tax=Arenibacter nanhaiticus TaxID=558155 RepID=A0A1M6JXQ3_9FLAO|nr:type I CRISPR-associated protein Cas7 [Arenibacter nanhaiticus]SHJ51490.1 CRISPR-associated protein Csh2 [Arenibacter nanhaiticus]